MTTSNETAPVTYPYVEWCAECENLFVMEKAETVCPICPMGEKYDAAYKAFHDHRPYRVLNESTRFQVENAINDATADGYTLVQVQTHYSPVNEEQFTAVMQRTDGAYDVRQHRLDRKRWQDARKDIQRVRLAEQRKVDALKRMHSRDAA